MYNVPFYNPQASIDRINSQIAELEKMKQQIPAQPIQPTNLTQNFQLAPNSTTMRYANSIDEVQKDLVIGDTPFFSKDLSVMWIKDIKGNIRTYELSEIVPKDEKDLEIEYLKSQIENLKKGSNLDEQYDKNVDATKVESDTTRNDETNGTAIEKG